jgi:hypothetical protein
LPGRSSNNNLRTVPLCSDKYEDWSSSKRC